MERVEQIQTESIEVFENDIEMHLQMFCEENNIENMRQESQSVWNSCLRYIYKHVFKGTGILKSKDNIYNPNNNIPSNYNRYNYNLVLKVLDVYIYDMCMKYDKEVSIIGFSTLTGIDTEVIYNWGRDNASLSSSSSEIYKKLHDFREESLSNKLATGNKNPVGILAILNRHYAWNLPGVSKEPAGKRAALSIDELPKIGQVAQIPEIKREQNQDIVVEE